MNRNKYEEILNQFEMYYPSFYNQAVDWWASGRMTIGVKLDNGDVLDYNHVDNTIRWVRTGADERDEESIRKAFGHNLEKFIPFTGLSKGELATKLGITNAMLSRYIKGNSMPSVDKAHQIARIIGCSTDELFDDTYMED